MYYVGKISSHNYGYVLNKNHDYIFVKRPLLRKQQKAAFIDSIGYYTSRKFQRLVSIESGCDNVFL